MLDTYENASLALRGFAYVLGTMSLTISFFSLMISITQSVKDQTHEYGYLRAMGIKSKEGMRIFMYE